MRSKKALLNTIAGLLYEFVAIICGFILPRLILSAFGSSYNGVTSSITQFLGYVALMKAGIGSVTRAALYKPLADDDQEKISGIVNATNRFLQRVAILFGITIILFAAIYPLFVKDDFDWLFTFTLVLILGISTFVQYFFGLTYQLILQADQRHCVISFVQIGTLILNTLIAGILIKLGASIHIVKLGSALIFSLNPLIINFYARRYYKIDKKVLPNNDVIKDRWDCFGLQIANFVNTNTDMAVLTIFTNVREVSVYSVYHMVHLGIKKLLLTFVSGIGSAFGDMFARNEEENIRVNLRLYEQITFALANLLYSVTLVMILSFVKLYTKDITDVNYIRTAFAVILIVAALFGTYRFPYQSIVEAVGHFKQTRNGAFFEAFLNIAISILMVKKFGMVGVAIGTLCAAIFRTIQYSLYLSKNLVKRSMWITIKRLILSAATVGGIVAASSFVPFKEPKNYFEWGLQSAIVFVIAAIIVFMVEILFYRKDLMITANKMLRIFKKRRK